MEVVSLIPFTLIAKLMLDEAKKVKDFKPLIEELVSTIERLVPIFEEIDLLQRRLDPGNKDLDFITKLMLKAKKMVRKCSEVRLYNIYKIKSYTRKIKEINDDFVKFCKIDLQFIQHKNHLRASSVTSLKIQESPPRGLEGQHRVSSNEGKGEQVQEDEQLSLALKESLIMKELLSRKAEALSSREAEELKTAIKESFSLCRQQEEQAAKRKLEEEKLVAVALEKSLNTEDPALREVIQESLSLQRQQEEKAKRKLEEEQRIIWESFKDKGKAKKVQEDEKSIVNTEDLSLRVAISNSQREEQMAKRRARELKINEQRVLLESFKTK
ncbi:unnamed protein product [Eruca vesicaria subsp. sativa]|uniref:RPW8 domain-containing protein n=1 Tax=Eruca vesicaria subsp. sativa TaxID=29727 RepID=A0ABC8JFI9_ERUVS|nr:unnamed protein product [Eruca vesicaria subsp. sativa]